MLDDAGEARLGKLQIGTTRRGIGPCYADKAARLGIRVQDLLDEKILKKKIITALEPKRLSLRPFARDPALDLQSMSDEYLTYGHVLEPYIADTFRLVLDDWTAARSSRSRARRRRCWTSTTGPIRSSPPQTPSRARPAPAPGRPRDIDRSGAWPRHTPPGLARGRFRPSWTARSPTSCASAAASTGRPPVGARRVGWIDLVALRYTARLNSLTALAITKLDVLSAFETIRVCVRYQSAEGAELDGFPVHRRAAPRRAVRGATRLRAGHPDCRTRPSCRRRLASCCGSSRSSSGGRWLVGVGQGHNRSSGWTRAPRRRCDWSPSGLPLAASLAQRRRSIRRARRV